MSRRPTAKQAAAAIDTAIEQAYYRVACGAQINMLDIGTVFRAGRQAIATGANLDDAIRAVVAQLRKN